MGKNFDLNILLFLSSVYVHITLHYVQIVFLHLFHRLFIIDLFGIIFQCLGKQTKCFILQNFVPHVFSMFRLTVRRRAQRLQVKVGQKRESAVHLNSILT
jgi:hypothetical protein